MAQMIGNILYIDEKTVVEALDLPNLIDGLEVAFKEFSRGAEGGVVQPVRASVPLDNHNGFLLSMPVYSRPHDTLVTKLVTVFPDNTEKFGLPGIAAHVFLYNAVNGSLNAIIEAEELSILRTSAATAAATKHLSLKNAAKLAIIGCGNEGLGHVKLLRLVRNFTEVRLWNRTKSKAANAAKELGAIACDTVEEAVKDADVIVTATMATEAVLFGKWVKRGALVNIVGAVRPTWREVDDDLMKSSQVFGDSKAAVLKEAGDVILSGVEVAGEIGDVISGKIKPDFSRTRVFKSQGMAVEDAVAAKLIYEAVKSKS